MKLGLHCGCIMNTNVVTDLRIANETGYDAAELWIQKLRRYFDVGYTAEDLKPHIGNVEVTMLNCVLSVESQDPEFRKALCDDMRMLAKAAKVLDCSTIQLIVLSELDGMSWKEMKPKLVESFKELADLVGEYGVRLSMEPVVFSDFKHLSQALEVIEACDRDNIGLVVDTWHVWTSEEPWSVVEGIDPKLIYSAHISDTNPMQGEHWHDDDRTALPGDGILPLEEGAAAIVKTGYQGVWSVEMLSHEHWEWDPMVLAVDLKERTERLLNKVMAQA